MRRILFAVPFLIACGGAEMPPADSAAMAPAALTDADVSGTWTGTSTPVAPDTGSVTFTISCSTGTCRATTSAAPNDTVSYTYTLAADSSMGTSAAHTDPMTKTMVVDHFVARVSGGSVTGHGWVTVAEMPDSVVGRYQFTGTRAP